MLLSMEGGPSGARAGAGEVELWFVGSEFGCVGAAGSEVGLSVGGCDGGSGVFAPLGVDVDNGRIVVVRTGRSRLLHCAQIDR